MIKIIKQIKIPHVFTLLTIVVFICSLFTYIITSGVYEREIKQVGTITRTVVVPGTYKELPKHFSAEGIIIGEEVEVRHLPLVYLGSLVLFHVEWKKLRI